jgi:hypothetical protein
MLIGKTEGQGYRAALILTVQALPPEESELRLGSNMSSIRLLHERDATALDPSTLSHREPSDPGRERNSAEQVAVPMGWSGIS